jgi:phage regulator Rha-like protein
MTANKAITSIKLSSMKGEARVDSRVIAERLDIQHESFINTLSKYENELKELGLLRFEIGAVKIEGQRGTKHLKYALLNEDQAVFALTLSRNNPTVVACKLALTKAFKQARTIANNQANPEWCQLRLELKFTHRAFTDALKALCEYAHTRGSNSTQDKFQMSYAKLLKQIFGYANRDTLDGLMLKTVEEAERLTALNIYAGIAANTPYKEIYQQVKVKIEAYAEIVKT